MHLGLSVTACILIRWDLIFAMLPAVILASFLSGRQWVRAVSVVSVFPFLLLVALILRAVLVGLPPTPLHKGIYNVVSEEELPMAFNQFWRTNILNMTDHANLQWSVWGRNYAAIRVALENDIFSGHLLAGGGREILQELSVLAQGSAIPLDLQERLVAQAMARVEAAGPTYFPKLIIQRAFLLWWEEDKWNASGFARSTISHQISYVANQYSRWLTIALIFICLGRYFRALPRCRWLIFGLILFLASRTTFLATHPALEIRYIAMSFPVVEVLIFIGLFLPFARQEKMQNSVSPMRRLST